jgi:uncharacterized iron-regulated protein
MVAPTTGKAYPFEQVLPALAQANILYLGERHDQAADHALQLILVQALYQQSWQPNGRQGRLAIALEMFQRPFQPVLNQYLAGEISEADLQQQSEYDLRWGFDWEYYAPILRFAREHQLPLIALSAPTEVTNQVVRSGMSSLNQQQQRWVPPLAELNLNVPDYRRMLYRFYEEIHANHGSSQEFERFFLIQTLWDETMAASLAEFWQAHRDYQVVVLAGQGHIAHNFGIPSRVARRLAPAVVNQRSILLNSEENLFGVDLAIPLADYLWRSPPPPTDSN